MNRQPPYSPLARSMGRLAICALVFWGCGRFRAPLESEILLEASADERPSWLDSAPRSNDTALVQLGRAGGSTVEGSFRRAEQDAVTELVTFYYGPIIDRAFGIDPDDTSPFIEDRDSNTSKETLNRVIERVLASGPDDPSRPVVLRRYWERYRIPTDDGAGREMVQAYTMVELKREAVDDVVAGLLGQSPTRIAMAGLEREAAFLVQETKRQVKQGIEAGRANRIPELVAAHRRAGQLIADLARVKDRYALIADKALAVEADEAKDGAAQLDRLAMGVLRGLRVGVSVSVYRGVAVRIPGLEQLLRDLLASLKVPTTQGVDKRCGGDTTHWIHASFDPPDCVRPEAGHVCELGLLLEISRCPIAEPVDSHQVDTAVLRGRGSSERGAVLAAWDGLQRERRDAFRRELHVLLSRHLPTRHGATP